MAENDVTRPMTEGGVPTPPSEAEIDDRRRPSRSLEIATAAAALVLSIVALVLSRSIELRMGGGGIDSRWWPTVLSIVAGTLSAALLATASFGALSIEDSPTAANRPGWVRMLSTLALTFLYVFAWSRFGYIVPTLLFLAALLWLFGLRRPLPLILFPAGTTAFIYGLFDLLLKVPL